jgi:hypothetical protein
MEKSNLSFITLLLLFINLIGCTVTPNITDQANSANTVATSTAFAFSQNTETAYPLIAPKDIKHDTAFNGLQIAVEFSKKWNKKAFCFLFPTQQQWRAILDIQRQVLVGFIYFRTQIILWNFLCM